MGLQLKFPYHLNLDPPEPPDPPELPDDLNFCLGGFGGLESGFGLLCSLAGVFLGGVFFVFWGFLTDFVSIFLGCLIGSTFSGSVLGLTGFLTWFDRLCTLWTRGR